MASQALALSGEIDDLLTTYLFLLDTYTTIRAQLSAAQASIYLSLARANFHAERGVRYGQDFYDERAMLPARVCRITPDNGIHCFEVKHPADVSEDAETPRVSAAEHGDGGKQDRSYVPDPLRMFGLAVPNALRETQAQTRGLLDLVPRLLTVDARMRALEIEIRRARKRRVKLLGEGAEVERGVHVLE
ncbi:hypothetical protein PZA11_004642 [Diplocarpon coronariae]|uniref:Vacuolar ATPase assembly protein VMA22 n=1 Tax=Diplocarpon coronariae TaxID=2795749 RepID=A0A218YY78_9HELO|nr:hypothetical protein JHW43_003722 [Diplocarpon mali]OWO99925.1 hypothetical protein B2J93_8545 [Marssonina coronariae]